MGKLFCNGLLMVDYENLDKNCIKSDTIYWIARDTVLYRQSNRYVNEK